MHHNEFVTFLSKHEKAIEIKDGIYNVTGISFLVAECGNFEEVETWIENRDKFWLANAYETDFFVLYDKEPRPYKGKHHGSGFNYGSTNVLIGSPACVLILAEND